MKKTIFLLMAVCLSLLMLTSCSKDDDTDGDSDKPSWNDSEKLTVTGNVTDITPFGATISGWANIDPVLTVAAKFGVIVSEDPKPSYSNGMQYSSYELKSDNSYQVEVEDLTPGTKYYYLSYVRIGDIYTYGDVRSFSTMELHLCPDNHHPHAIDLGLPSGTKWACCNVGATAPEDYGGYYAWGETSEKSDYDDGYAYWQDKNGNGWMDSGECTNIGSDIAGTQYDVAHIRMGSSWRMPNAEQINELINNCTHKWTKTNQNGVKGILVTGKNSGQIFLPAAGIRLNSNFSEEGSLGYYWSSSLELDSDGSFNLQFGSMGWSLHGCNCAGRWYGLTVRAVCP